MPYIHLAGINWPRSFGDRRLRLLNRHAQLGVAGLNVASDFAEGVAGELEFLGFAAILAVISKSAPIRSMLQRLQPMLENLAHVDPVAR